MMSTKPLLAVSLVEMIAADLQTKIIDEEFRAGDRLVIDSIARLYNVSLVPVREALVRLHTQGLLTFVPNVGYRIAPALSAEDLDKLFEARVVIEAGALRSAVRLGTPPDVGHLRELNDRMARDRYETRNYASFRQFSELNDAFHRGLVMLSDNNFLVKAYDPEVGECRYGARAAISVGQQERQKDRDLKCPCADSIERARPDWALCGARGRSRTSES